MPVMKKSNRAYIKKDGVMKLTNKAFIKEGGVMKPINLNYIAPILETIFETTFNNTPIGGRVVDFEIGDNWTQGDGTKDFIRVSATGVGAISGSTGTQPYFHSIYRDNEVGNLNYIIESRINFFKQISNPEATGIIIGLDSATGNQIIFGIIGDAQTLSITEVVAGNETDLISIPYGEAGFPVEGNDTKDLRVDVTSTQIIGYVDDVEYLRYNHGGTLHGNNVGLRAIKGIGNIQASTFEIKINK